MEMIKIEHFYPRSITREMKRFLCALFALMILLSLPALAEAEENLVTNGDFSEVDSMGNPSGWIKGMWLTDEGVSRLYVDENGYDGNCAVVFNADDNDARFTQILHVEPDSYYRFSCMVKAEGCGSEGYGATLSFESTFSYSESVLDTAGEWRELCVYGHTGKDQTEATLMVRIGGYSMVNTGRAFFDNVECVRVDKTDVPEDALIVELATNKPSSNSNSSSTTSDDAPPRNTEAYLLLAALYGLLVLAAVRRSGRFARSRVPADLLLAAGFAGAFLLRVALALCIRGYNTDINCFSAWSERMFEIGPAGFYAADYFCDYPPGYMLLLWIPAALRRLLGLGMQSAEHLLLLKLIPIVCDLLGAALIWRVTRKHGVRERIAAALALFYALNPAVFVDSAAWGQIDSVFTLLIALCALEAADEKYIPSLIAFAAAMLIKPQAMLFGPLGLFAILYPLLRKRDPRKIRQFLTGAGCALALLYLTAFAFCVGRAQGPLDALVGPVVWLVRLYGATLGSYAYLTINALNLYALLGLNWAATAEHTGWLAFAWCMFALSYVYAGFLVVKSKKPRGLLLAGAVLMALICSFGPMIHERYIYPALLLLMLSLCFERDRRLLISLTVMTITVTMNEVLVLQGGMTEANYGHLQNSEQWLNALLSMVGIANTLYLCWAALDICALGHRVPLRVTAVDDVPSASPIFARGHKLNLRRRDWLLMAGVTAVYAVVAFVGLGSMTAPQTSWVSSQSGENIVFDLGQTQPFRMTYYGGICNSTFTVELSNDGEIWTTPYRALYEDGEIFRWLWYVPMDESAKPVYGATIDPGDGSAYVTFPSRGIEEYPYQTARYVRITAESAGLRLSEVAFLDESGAPLPVEIASRGGEYADYATDPALLIDEQDIVPAIPNYYNGTYFDEIYHARTAYELKEGNLSIYEWTHPPLGKLVMSLGICLFGMTPFGWRFMGALTGVLMVPLMYLLAKQLTKSTKLSFIAMALMTLDSMHFTQTRIATIDSYAVFWIMLMYLFMIRYVQMDWREVSLGRSFATLGLCGVTMGIAWATKWIGLYASAGLAILFFWKLISEIARAGERRRACLRRGAWTCLFCVGFFVIIPVLIYYLSYTRQLRVEGVEGVLDMFSKQRLDRVVQLQKSMYNYHAGLANDKHFYRSPWYQWPVIWWPMWYFSGSKYLSHGMVASISCMGNPAVWWTGLAALIFVLIGSAWKKRAPKEWLIVLIGFASQYLPWVLVPRSTFIYHYFASVPFIILCTILLLGWLRKRSERGFHIASGILLALALGLFVMFYPLESGVPMSREYALRLRWLKWYNYDL